MNERSAYQEKIDPLIQEFEKQIKRLQSNVEKMEGIRRDQIKLQIEKLTSLHNVLQSQYRLLVTAEENLAKELQKGNR